MEKSKNYIQDIHKDNQNWLKDLQFYADELLVFDKELVDVSSKNTSKDVKQEVEKFQNQFIIQRNEIDYLRHLATLQEDHLVAEVKENPVAVDHRKMTENQTLKNRMAIFVPIYTEMKDDFRTFLSKHL